MNVLIHHYNFLHPVSRERFSDLELKTECGNSLFLHKVVAAAISTKLSCLLSNDISVLTIRNVKFSALKNIIDFAYRGKIVLSTKGDLQDFAATYTYLKVNLGPKINKFVDDVDMGMTNSAVELENSCPELIELVCSNCNKIFETKTQLNRHIREVHNKEQAKPSKQQYVCEKCEKVSTVQ